MHVYSCAGAVMHTGVYGCMGAESSGMLGRAAGKIRPEGGPVGYRD
jgi:hypothetical protein